MRTGRGWPLWAGMTAGVVAAAVISLLLRQGTVAGQEGVQRFDVAEFRTGFAVLLISGVVVGAVALLARKHPLLAGIPAAWFLILYGPAAFSGTAPSWFPAWMTEHFLVTASPAAFLATGVFVAATAASLWASLNK